VVSSLISQMALAAPSCSAALLAFTIAARRFAAGEAGWP
jgi:hypothetical protein